MDNKEVLKQEGKPGSMIGGMILIVIGVLALIAQFVDVGETLGLMVLPAMGLIFIAAGIVTRQSGFFIPGGILSGLGLGTILMVTAPFEDISDEASAGVFMFSFAAGWLLIPLLTMIFTRGERHLWALIVAAIMALVGAGLTFGGAAMDALIWLGKFWPIFLILGGLVLLLRRNE